MTPVIFVCRLPRVASGIKKCDLLTTAACLRAGYKLQA
nr:MAG TPA_asm: hypothetical protein [Caudoviricetes sp.]